MRAFRTVMRAERTHCATPLSRLLLLLHPVSHILSFLRITSQTFIH